MLVVGLNYNNLILGTPTPSFKFLKSFAPGKIMGRMYIDHIIDKHHGSHVGTPLSTS